MWKSDYLRKTESAVRKLFEGMESHKTLLHEGRIRGPVGAYANDEEALSAGRQWAETNKDMVSQLQAKQREYMAEYFALATLCGAVFQIAEKGIEIHPEDRNVPKEWQDYVCSNDKRSCYFCGRLVRGVPVGLVIHAGRNQYAHFEDGALNKLCTEVFRRMAENHNSRNPTLDIVFNLAGTSGNGTEIFAAALLQELGWDSYEAYERDMRELVGS